MTKNSFIALKAEITDCTKLWHQRYGHSNYQSLNDLWVRLVDCQNWRIQRRYMKDAHLASIIEKDLKVESLRDHHNLYNSYTLMCVAQCRQQPWVETYFLMFVDDCTSMWWVYFMRNKSEMFGIFNQFKSIVELQSGFKIKKLSDRGCEYTFTRIQGFLWECWSRKTTHSSLHGYIPQKNGVADKENTRRSSICVWGETVNTAVYLDKRSHTKAINKKTPFEAFSSRKPGVRQMRVFGSICYA